MMTLVTALMLMAAAPPAPLAAVPAAGPVVQPQELPAAGPVGQPGGWTAWHGCWRPVGDAAPLNALVCMVPGDAGAVRMLALEDGAVVDETVLHADGVARPVDDGGCTGTQHAAWSADGRRVFVSTDLDCAGTHRVTTGVIAMVAENEWLDIQALVVGDQRAARSVRYRAVHAEQVPEAVRPLLPSGRDPALEAARLHVSAPVDYDAVVEATARVAPAVVEALIAARRHGYALDAARLVELERRGVPPSVLDVMIAVSYPERFAVREREPREPSADRATAYWPGSLRYSDCRDPWSGQRLTMLECDRLRMYGYGLGFSRFGFSRLGFSPWGYSPWGYSRWGYDPYGWRYGQLPLVVIERPAREERGGELVRGHGYGAAAGAEESGRRARPRDDGATMSRPASPGASARPASATAGSPESGSGTATGRRAVPRTGGGGGGERQDG
jgi:hypothetical protein